MNVFIGTNVLLDVLARREPFYRDSAMIWTLAEQGRIAGQVSVVSFTNIFYIVRRLRDVTVSRRSLRMLRDTFTAVACDSRTLGQAIDADFADFEDAVQYFSAARVRAACLVTRNPDHYPRTGLPVLSPGEFLAAYSFA